MRVDRRERDQDVGVGGGDLGDLLVRTAARPVTVSASTREDDRGHVSLAVVRGNVLDGRHAVLAEVLRGGGLAPLGAQTVLARDADLGMRVDVDRDDLVEVDSSELRRGRP